ncbi:SET domain-containing protein [Tothia fuscella]|uniref:SET domain-containing protein n=1 Tax=Tothia fuscella TaxID=1048955 RepID=A0A9P4TVF8_9PEZI|nr:SET domain-containing protein [Tothia fuscella]
MIRRGKREGWLNLPPSAVRPWAGLNGVTFDGVKIGSIAGRGTGVVASRVLKGGNEGPLMVIPGDLILSLERVELQAKSDQKLQELLSTLGDYARTTRGAILVFLLRQATIANPQVTETIGTINPFTEYIKFLPEEMLPTFWTEEERALLMGTSLHPALEAKLTSLQKEFDNVRTATENIPWCSKYWWGVGTGLLSFDDWLQVDAMYRSRALEFPGIGDSMVPCIDMANHASGDGTAALYETDGHGNGVLLLRDGSDLTEGQEVTIT